MLLTLLTLVLILLASAGELRAGEAIIEINKT